LLFQIVLACDWTFAPPNNGTAMLSSDVWSFDMLDEEPYALRDETTISMDLSMPGIFVSFTSRRNER
jgi:hypothetical protein